MAYTISAESSYEPVYLNQYTVYTRTYIHIYIIHRLPARLTISKITRNNSLRCNNSIESAPQVTFYVLDPYLNCNNIVAGQPGRQHY